VASVVSSRAMAKDPQEREPSEGSRTVPRRAPPGEAQQSPHDPETLKQELAALRTKIDAADDGILRLLNQRAEHVRRVADLKTAIQVPFYVPSRERQIAERLAAANPGPFPSESIRSVFQEIFSACLTLEKRVRVAYLGPEGTFSDIAVKKQFGLSARSVPMGTIPSV